MCFSPYLYFETTRLFIGWWSRGRVKNKNPTQFPHAASHNSSHACLRLDFPESEKEAAISRGKDIHCCHIVNLRSAQRLQSGRRDPLVLTQTTLPTSRSPKEEGQKPAGTGFQKEAGEVICSLSTSITSYTLTAKRGPGPVLRHNMACSPMAWCSFLPLRRTDSPMMPQGTSLVAAVPQMRPRYWLGWWPLPRATATPECTPTITTNHRLLVSTPRPCPASFISTGPATGATSALFNKTGLKAKWHSAACAHTEHPNCWPGIVPGLWQLLNRLRVLLCKGCSAWRKTVPPCLVPTRWKHGQQCAGAQDLVSDHRGGHPYEPFLPESPSLNPSVPCPPAPSSQRAANGIHWALQRALQP